MKTLVSIVAIVTFAGSTPLASAEPSFQDQAICRQQAEKFYNTTVREEREDVGDHTSFSSDFENYIKGSNLCLVRISFHWHTYPANGGVSQRYTSTLQDAFSGRFYGQFQWHNEVDKKFWEVSPVLCNLGGFSAILGGRTTGRTPSIST